MLQGGLFRSDDGGASWRFNEALWQREERAEWFGGGADVPVLHTVLVDPRDPDHITAAVSCGGVWQSHDGGDSWTLTAAGMRADFMPPARADDPRIQAPHRLAACAASPDRVWCQHHNGVYRSDDGGTTWHDLSESARPSRFGFAVAAHSSAPDTAWFVPAVKDEERVPVAGAVVVSRTRDGGQSFEVLRSGLPQRHAYDLVYRHSLTVGPHGETLAFGSTTGNLFLSHDGGDTWTVAHAHLPPIYAVDLV